jgi:uncharacterized membrane protein YdbT with pleckstrin-like domain
MDLHPGEHVIYEGHPSWRSTFSFYVVGLLIAIGAGVIGYLAADESVGLAAAIAIGIFVVVLVVGWLRRVATRYLITNKRLSIRRGIISKNIEETRVDRIVDVTARQNPWQRMLLIGDVDFDNASGQQGPGQSGDLFRFAGIAAPHEVTRAVNRVHEELRSAPAGPPPPTAV